MRGRHVDSFLHMWHTADFLSVPFSVRVRTYPALPNELSNLEAPQYICVPTLSAMAYVSARWIPYGLAGTLPRAESRRLIDAILISEWQS